ncbi:hypothetical protein LTR66_008589 [Elasticomyces elasticus]|nr:hypothetical protein LTR66_008589 [Elasticomyces elasticus]
MASLSRQSCATPLAPAPTESLWKKCRNLSHEINSDALNDEDLLDACTVMEDIHMLSDDHIFPDKDIQQLPTPLHSDAVDTNKRPVMAQTQLACTRSGKADDDNRWAIIDNLDETALVDMTGSVENQTCSHQNTVFGAQAVAGITQSGTNIEMVDSEDTTFGAIAGNLGRDQAQVIPVVLPDLSSKPIVRSPFPIAIRDRSPIIGLSASTVSRTCFRVGEALNVGCAAVRNNRSTIIELYARVTSSFREPESVRQHFVFADLYHTRPPFLIGVYEVWKGVELWDFDSARFLDSNEDGRLCRCIGRMKRDGTNWKLSVLNIWEASWEDIEYAAGLHCA